MVTQNELKKIVSDVASEKRLNTKQIEALMKVVGIKDLLINPLVCMKCGKVCSVVGKYATCDPCEETLSKSDKKFLNDMGGATPQYLDDYEMLNPPEEAIVE